MEKIKNIEILRFFMILIIVLYHMFNKDSLLLNLIPNSLLFNNLHKTIGTSGQTCVDLFFIISGYFLSKTFNKSNTVTKFLYKKIIRLMPVIIFLFIGYKLISFLDIVNFDNYSNIMALFLINNIGLTLKSGCISGSWFVSVLVSVSTFYFYILKHFHKKITDLFIILITIIGYAFLIHVGNGHIGGNIKSVAYIFNLGIIRGLSGIGLGIIISNILKDLNINNSNHNFKNIFIFSYLEIYIFIFLFNNLTFHKLSYHNDIIIILAFTILFCLFILKKGLLSKTLDINFSAILGKYTYSIFLTHLFIIRIINFYIWKPHISFVIHHQLLQIIIVIFSTILFGILTYHFVEKPFSDYFSKKYLNIKEQNINNN